MLAKLLNMPPHHTRWMHAFTAVSSTQDSCRRILGLALLSPYRNETEK